MQAIVQTRYGPAEVLELREVDKPRVGDDQVLVRVFAASLHPDIWHVMTGSPYLLRIMGSGLLKPRNQIPGTDVAGRIEAVGSAVSKFQPGDDVFGESVQGHQWKNGGAFAEYVAVAEEALVLKPPNLSYVEAAVVPTSGLIAHENLRGRVQPGHRVLINGAGGGGGVFAVQLAKSFGGHVTAVDSATKLDMLRSIGADEVIDYEKEDWTRPSRKYDLLFDVIGDRSLSDARRALTRKGSYVLIGHERFGASGARWIGSLKRFAKMLVLSPLVSQRLGPRVAKKTEPPLFLLSEMLRSGELRPVVSQTFPLAEVRDTIRFLTEGSAVGKVAITI